MINIKRRQVLEDINTHFANGVTFEKLITHYEQTQGGSSISFQNALSVLLKTANDQELLTPVMLDGVGGYLFVAFPKPTISFRDADLL